MEILIDNQDEIKNIFLIQFCFPVDYTMTKIKNYNGSIGNQNVDFAQSNYLLCSDKQPRKCQPCSGKRLTKSI